MRFIADALQQSQRGAVRIERERIHAVAREDDLLFLRETNRNEIRTSTRFQRRIRRVQLTFATVDHDQIRKRSAILEDLRVAPAHNLFHRCEVIEKPPCLTYWPLRLLAYRPLLLDLELSIFRRTHAAFFTDHHRRDRFRSLDRRDIEAVDATRQLRQSERGLQ